MREADAGQGQRRVNECVQESADAARMYEFAMWGQWDLTDAGLSAGQCG